MKIIDILMIFFQVNFIIVNEFHSLLLILIFIVIYMMIFAIDLLFNVITRNCVRFYYASQNFCSKIWNN